MPAMCIRGGTMKYFLSVNKIKNGLIAFETAEFHAAVGFE